MSTPAHPLLRSIGLAIRSHRRARRLSQEELADLARLDRSYMSSVERGRRNISILALVRIAAALDVPLWELVRPRRVAGHAPPELGGDVQAWLQSAAAPPSASRAPAPLRPPVPSRRWEPGYLSLG